MVVKSEKGRLVHGSLAADRFTGVTDMLEVFASMECVSGQARSQDFGGEESGSGSHHQKRVRGCHLRKIFEKRACDLVYYIASVA